MKTENPALLPKILVVDDERGTRESLRFALQRDYAVLTAASVEEGLDFLGRESFDTVVLDLRLPGRDGIEGLRRIRALDPHLAVVMLTAYASLDTAVEALRLGASDYCTKPFDVPDLLGVIRHQVEMTRAARRQESALAHDLQRVNDNLAARLVADEHLVHVGRLAGALLHDLNGPLTNLNLSLDILRGDLKHLEREPVATRQSVTSYIDDTRTTLGLITEMIRTHRQLSLPCRRERLPVPLGSVLDTVLKVVQPLAAERGCQLRRWAESSAMLVLGERLGLFRIFYNLLANALDAVPATLGRIEIVCTAENTGWSVAIHDNGPGIPAATLKRLLTERYVSTKPQGTGLGLAIAQDLAREHGGRLDLASTVGVGTTATVWLPRPPWAAAGPAAAAPDSGGA